MIERFLVVKEGDAVIRVNWSSVLYISRQGRKLNLITDEGSINFYGKVSELSMPADGRFYRILDGLLVNMDRIKKIEKCRIYFDEGTELEISREHIGRLKQRLFSYLKELEG